MEGRESLSHTLVNLALIAIKLLAILVLSAGSSVAERITYGGVSQIKYSILNCCF